MTSGPWLLSVPNIEVSKHGESSKGVLVVPAKKINLLAELTPTLMEEWQLNNIRLPFFVQVGAAASGALLKKLETRIEGAGIIRYGGDIVWYNRQSQVLTPNVSVGEHEGGPEYFTGYMSFVETLTESIDVKRGRALELELGFTVSARTTEGEEPANLAVTVTTAGANPTIDYTIEVLSGRRTL